MSEKSTNVLCFSENSLKIDNAAKEGTFFKQIKIKVPSEYWMNAFILFKKDMFYSSISPDQN